jgi:type VI secretion system secreted protein Hcp
MALNAYLRVEGETQGEIKGSVTQSGREDTMMIIGFSHEVVSPRDAASGRATGKRQHKPLTITKEIDKASPLLMQALVTNENLVSVILQFWQASRTGKELQFYTIHLENASIFEIKQEMLNNKYPENMKMKEMEHISFAYQRISWVFEDGGIRSEDEWTEFSARATKSKRY